MIKELGKSVYLYKDMTSDIGYKRNVDKIIKVDKFFEKIGEKIV